MISEKDLSFSMAALKDFKKEFEISPFAADITDPDIASGLLYYGLKYGKHKGEDFDRDKLDMDSDYGDTIIALKAFQKTWKKLESISNEAEKN